MKAIISATIEISIDHDDITVEDLAGAKRGIAYFLETEMPKVSFEEYVEVTGARVDGIETDLDLSKAKSEIQVTLTSDYKRSILQKVRRTLRELNQHPTGRNSMVYLYKENGGKVGFLDLNADTDPGTIMVWFSPKTCTEVSLDAVEQIIPL